MNTKNREPSQPAEPIGEHPPGRLPDAVVARAKAAFSRRGEGPVAELVFDSLVDGGGSPTCHVLQFRHPSISLDVRVSKRGHKWDLEGAVMPERLRRVELQPEGQAPSIAVPVLRGRFELRKVPSGLFRLRLSPDGDYFSASTDWFRL